MQIFVHSLGNIKCPTILKLLTCSVNTHVFNSLLFKSLKRFVFMILCPPSFKGTKNCESKQISEIVSPFDKRLNSPTITLDYSFTHSPSHPFTQSRPPALVDSCACLSTCEESKAFPSNLSLKLPIQNNLSIPLSAPLSLSHSLSLSWTSLLALPLVLLFLFLLSWHIQLLSFSFCAWLLQEN